MAFIDPVVEELRYEAAGTRKLLERIPEAKAGWQPHPKSMPLGVLGAHVAELISWAPAITEAPEYNFVPAEYTPPKIETKAALLGAFDANVETAVSALKALPDPGWMETWTFKKDGEVVFQLPRIAVVRSMILSHMIHHRGQLTVYLRMNDVPLPAIYGPSADEG